MTKGLIFVIASFFMGVGLFANPASSLAQPMCPKCPMWSEPVPFGGYCPGPRGWYGARRVVKTIEEARHLLEKYFKNKDVVIGDIKEREWFFEAEIKGKDNNLIDIVIVDKRTGRIRSIY